MDELDRRIIELLGTGMTRQQIANELGVTKGSVCGRVFRMEKKGLLKIQRAKPLPPVQRSKKVQTPRAVAARKPPPITEQTIIVVPPPIERVFPVHVAPDTSPVQRGGYFLDELTSFRQCRYPIGAAEGQHLFCGVMTDRLVRPYCPDHYKLVWVKHSLRKKVEKKPYVRPLYSARTKGLVMKGVER